MVDLWAQWPSSITDGWPLHEVRLSAAVRLKPERNCMFPGLSGESFTYLESEVSGELIGLII
jgi:hypothetical protein